MIFIALSVFAVGLYVWGYKIPALLVMFFFLTTGFQLVPEEMMESVLTKSTDYAFCILLGIILVDAVCIKNYFRMDKYAWYIVGWGCFNIIVVAYSKFNVGLSWGDIIRVCRFQFFWAAYFVFRNFDKADLEKLLLYLFNITVVISCIYLLQVILNEFLLNGDVRTYAYIFGEKISRFYNQPMMIHFFAFMALYCNPYQGVKKYLTTIILVAALLGAFHRSVFGFTLMAVIVGYALRLKPVNQIRFFAVFGSFILAMLIFSGTAFLQSRTFSDLKNISEGNYIDADNIDVEELAESTFTFRIAHLYERNQYLLEHPKRILLGAGLIHEESKQTDRMFDFQLGLIEDLTGRRVQIDTSDISYSSLLLRYGYLGTLFVLFLYGWLMVYCFKHRKSKYGFFSFLYFVFSFGCSLFCANLTTPITWLLPIISYWIIEKESSEETVIVSPS